MKYWISLVCCSTLWMACQQDKAMDLEGNWKIYKISYGGKDISKSSDPFNENGISFYEDNTYKRFGNAGFQDTGSYTLEEDWLVFASEQDSLKQYTIPNLQQDTLEIVIPLEEDDTLKMGLYKMKE